MTHSLLDRSLSFPTHSTPPQVLGELSHSTPENFLLLTMW